MSATERLQSMITQLKSMEVYLNELISREAIIVRLIEEGRAALESLKALDGKEEFNVMMPIGLGIYAQSTIDPDAKFLVNVGSGISIEKSRADAITFIESRLRELEAGLNNTIAQKNQIETSMEEIRKNANSLVMQMQKQ